MEVDTSMEFCNNLLKLTERLVNISEFNTGKTSLIFDDVKNNNAEYVVLKNNQPTAIVISIESYRKLINMAGKMEAILEKIEEERLLKLAQSRMDSYDPQLAVSHDDFVREMGLDPAEIKRDCESVEIE